MAEPTLQLLQTMLQNVLDEQRSMRDDMAVMMAVLQRLDGTVSGLVNEVRAMHAQHARIANRVRDLEDRQ